MRSFLAAPLVFLALASTDTAEAARKPAPAPSPAAPSAQTEDAAPRAQPPAPAQPPASVVACLWASRTYSEGAQFCVGPKTALKCIGGSWQAQAYEPCGNAAVIDAK